MCLINEKIILFRDKKLLLIDVKNREIQDKIELTKVLKNANYSPKLLPLNDQFFLLLHIAYIAKFEILNDSKIKMIEINKDSFENFIGKYYGKKLIFGKDNKINIYKCED